MNVGMPIIFYIEEYSLDQQPRLATRSHRPGSSPCAGQKKGQEEWVNVASIYKNENKYEMFHLKRKWAEFGQLTAAAAAGGSHTG